MERSWTSFLNIMRIENKLQLHYRGMEALNYKKFSDEEYVICLFRIWRVKILNSFINPTTEE